MITVYGIPNCDTVKKARRWLDEHNVNYRFHDFRKDGLDAERVRSWISKVGWETLINRRGTTWRQLDATVREGLAGDAAIELALDHPAVIKRPVLVSGDHVLVGFDPERYAALAK